MSLLQTPIPTETWIPASWDDYLLVSSAPAYAHCKGYYYKGQMRLEAMSPLGNPHSRDHFIVLAAISLYTSLRNLDLDGHDNCTYRQVGCSEVQPDASFYLGNKADLIPWDAAIIALDTYPAPDLVIEVADTSLADDKGEKRLLYETLGVSEYWIIDVQRGEIIAFAIANGGSARITESQVLPGLEIALLEEALRRSRQMNHGKVSAWLLSQLQP
jgi:Uma2 family endonuclease